MDICLKLAARGLGSTSPNPMVGSVVVLDDQIVGQGWHRKAGEPHAEVLAVADALKHIKPDDLSRATLYVNLEPCSHWGRTPPCADMIIEHSIAHVVVGCIDPFAKVSGHGVDKMRRAGIDVTVGVRQDECERLNCRFFTSHTAKRPYVILKWAETSDGYLDAIRPAKTPPAWMTGDECRTLVHKWRAQEDAIMVGRVTALLDNPALTVRDWHPSDGSTPCNPLRVVTDLGLKLPTTLKIFKSQAATLLITSTENLEAARRKFEHCKTVQIEGIPYESTPTDRAARAGMLSSTLELLHKHGVQSLIVEGGTTLLSTFIDAEMWDEARIFTARMLARELYPTLSYVGGVRAPYIDKTNCVAQDNRLGLKIFYRRV